MELTRIIQAPIVTEKSDMLMREGKYTFKVDFHANKFQVAQAVEHIFKVNVVDVNIIRVGKKPKKLGRFAGFQNRYKKAIITVAAGESINYYPEEDAKKTNDLASKEAKAKEKEAQNAKSNEVAKRVSEKLAKKTATKTNKTVTQKTTPRKVGSGN